MHTRSSSRLMSLRSGALRRPAFVRACARPCVRMRVIACARPFSPTHHQSSKQKARPVTGTIWFSIPPHFLLCPSLASIQTHRYHQNISQSFTNQESQWQRIKRSPRDILLCVLAKDRQPLLLLTQSNGRRRRSSVGY